MHTEDSITRNTLPGNYVVPKPFESSSWSVHYPDSTQTSALSPQPLDNAPETRLQPTSRPPHTMGNDGGSIPKRRELVKEAAKALTSAQLKEAQTEQQEYGWSSDPLTRKPLARPVVADAAGVLYNKDSIIEFLLKDDDDAEKAEMRKVAGVKGTVEGGFAELGSFGDRVKGLKDVVEVQFEIAEEEGEKGRGEKWVCPITGTALGPNAKAVYLVPCGHAFAGSVVKEVAGSACLTVCIPFVTVEEEGVNVTEAVKRGYLTC